MKQKTQNIAHDELLILFRYTGYYRNTAEFRRLLANHRIAYKEAFEAYVFGCKIRQNRIKCGVAL
jgi:transposase-like protein